MAMYHLPVMKSESATVNLRDRRELAAEVLEHAREDRHEERDEGDSTTSAKPPISDG